MSGRTATLHTFLSGPPEKRQKISYFREIVGSAVPESIASDCLNSCNGDLERAVDMYFTTIGSTSNPISLDDEDQPSAALPSSSSASALPSSSAKLVECICIGSINCSGSLTTKLSAASNELYMDTPLDCSFSIKPPPPGAFPNTPADMINIMHGNGFVRFSVPKNKSEIGRLPAPLAAAICPLVILGLAEISLSVAFPGCAGMNLGPGASVPVRVLVAVTPLAMNRQHGGLWLDDAVGEKIASCWATVLTAMNISVSTAVDGAAPATAVNEEKLALKNAGGPEPVEDKDADEDQSSPDDPDTAMSEEMQRLVDCYSKPALGKLFPPPSLFLAKLKPYQAQALLWMASREYPSALGGIPATITNSVVIHSCAGHGTESVQGDMDEEATPPSWTTVPSSTGSVLYYKDGRFQSEKPAAVVECRGGILGDEMGLGKTVMTLALIALDKLVPSASSSPIPTTTLGLLPAASGGTLIILHLSLLRQWIGELNRYCPSLTFLEFHGSDRTVDLRKLAAVDVVFSTYGTVAVGSENGQSPLMQILWRRVVLDEAHSIRTRATKMAKAVARLQAERRWCLTGTPLQNSVEDIYPLVAWLRVFPWRQFAFFKKEVLNKLESKSGVSDGLRNAQRMLTPIMLRRTKATRAADGQPLVELPPRRNKIVQIEMAPEEKDFYRALFWKTKLEFDKFEKSNAVMFNITHVLQLVVRLRQALCHPVLCRAALATQDWVATNTNGVESLDDLLNKFLAASTKEGFASKEFIANAIEDLKRIGITNIECPICLTEPCQFPVMTPCGHTMCRKCVMARLRSECPLCRTVFVNSDIQNINHLNDASSTALSGSSDNATPCPPLSSKLRALLDYLQRDLKRGRRVIVFSQFVGFLNIIASVLSNKKVPHRMYHGALSSGQRQAAVDWLNDNTDSSGGESDESHDYLDHIGEGLVEPSDVDSDPDGSEEGTRPAPRKRGSGRVLLVSLKAGGVGLNLVAANVVYLTDLWWNPATEEQAFQRVHRLGQSRKTLTYKFVCRDTIDERILDLQASKSDMTSDVLGDTQVSSGAPRPKDGSGRRKLTLEDIRQLFRRSPDT